MPESDEMTLNVPGLSQKELLEKRRKEVAAIERSLTKVTKELYTRQGLTQIEFARKAMLPQPTVSQTLNGKGRRWTIAFLITMAEAAGVTPDQLLTAAVLDASGRNYNMEIMTATTEPHSDARLLVLIRTAAGDTFSPEAAELMLTVEMFKLAAPKLYARYRNGEVDDYAIFKDIQRASMDSTALKGIWPCFKEVAGE